MTPDSFPLCYAHADYHAQFESCSFDYPGPWWPLCHLGYDESLRFCRFQLVYGHPDFSDHYNRVYEWGYCPSNSILWTNP